ncbi:hypothetical protein C8R46DRAFT_216637 [Mycena filopes]|nr:hypothetical protein C8R46DRAFT_216637 [Mycena filopes]
MDYVQGLDPSKLTLGLTSQENSDGQALQTFTGLLGASVIFDIVWMLNNEQSGFIKFLSLLLLLLKVPTFVAFGLALRQRGGQFSGLGIRGNDLGGATVWDSMPGGFGAGGNSGYQNVDEERPAQYSRPAPPPTMPVAQPAAAQAPAAAAPGAGYQTV